MLHPNSRVVVLTWIAKWIALQSADTVWFTDPKIPIAKASLTFIAKFW